MTDYTTGGIAMLSSGAEVNQARRVISLEESEQTEKTLHHLNGRVQELRARLERVLIPAGGVAGGTNELKQPEAVSPLTDRLRRFRKLAQESIDTVEDILNRLDA